MRILFVTNYFQPEPNFFMGLPFAKELARRGHDVEVLTGFPNYPGGKIYPGYRLRLYQKEVMEAIPVRRVFLYPSHDSSAVKRVLTYTSFAASAACLGPWVVKPTDVAYVAQGPITIGIPAMVLKLLRRIPYILDIKDLWPDSLEATGMFSNKLGLRMVNHLCHKTYRHAKKITVCTPGIRQRLLERGVPEDKIEVVYNWCDDEAIRSDSCDNELAEKFRLRNKFNIVFAGNIGKAQSLGLLIEAGRTLHREYPNVQFVLFGGGVEVENLKSLAAANGLTNIVFHPRQPVSEIGRILSLADLLLVHLKDEPLFRITIPSKTQAYMAVGRPILMGVKGDATDLIRKAEAGICFEPDNPASLVEAIRTALALPQEDLNRMGTNGREFYRKEMSFACAVEKFERLFGNAVMRSTQHLPSSGN